MKLNKGFIHKLVELKHPVLAMFMPENPEFTTHIFIVSGFKDDPALDKYMVTGLDVTELSEIQGVAVNTGITQNEISLITKIESLPIVEMEFSRNFSYQKYTSYHASR